MGGWAEYVWDMGGNMVGERMLGVRCVYGVACLLEVGCTYLKENRILFCGVSKRGRGVRLTVAPASDYDTASI
jgi:hypothetical protein